MKNLIVVSIILIFVFVAFLSINFIGSFLGFGISIPPNQCDLVTGLQLYGDVLESKHEACIYDLAMKNNDWHLCNQLQTYNRKEHCMTSVAMSKKDPNICNKLGNFNEYGRPDLGKWRCTAELAANMNNLDLCNQVKYDDLRIDCQEKLSKSELNNTDIQGKALQLARENKLSLAIKTCQELQVEQSKWNCYIHVSDGYSGITLDNMFAIPTSNRPDKLARLCLSKPDNYEWLACLYGNQFSQLTGTDIYISQFKNAVRTDSYKKKTFCDLFTGQTKPPIIGGFQAAAELKNEVCK